MTPAGRARGPGFVTCVRCSGGIRWTLFREVRGKVKRRISGLVGCAAALVFMGVLVWGAVDAEAKDTLQRVKERGVLIVGLEAGFEPFEFIVDGEIVDYDVDLANKLVERLGVKVQLVDTAFGGLIPGLIAGRFDILISGVPIQKTDMESVNFSRPYADATRVMIRRKGDDRLNSPRDLAGRRVALQAATTSEFGVRRLSESLVAEGLPPITIVAFDHTPEAFLALAQRRVDAVSTTFPRALAALAQTPDTFEIVGPLDVPEYTGIVTRLESTELAREVDAMLTEMMESGELQQLQEKWFGRAFDLPEKIEW